MARSQFNTAVQSSTQTSHGAETLQTETAFYVFKKGFYFLEWRFLFMVLVSVCFSKGVFWFSSKHSFFLLVWFLMKGYFLCVFLYIGCSLVKLF